jgi:hypothetical protein
MIAAHAISVRAVLVAKNVTDFSDILGLSLENGLLDSSSNDCAEPLAGHAPR